MPTLAPRPISIAIDNTPELGYFGLAINDEGWVAYIASMRDAPMIRIVDSTGALRAAFGRPGEGPGEFGMPTLVAWDAGDLVIRSRGTAVARFAATGAFKQEYRTRVVGASLGLSPAYLTAAIRTGNNGAGSAEILRMPLSEGQAHPLSQDTLYRKVVESFAERGTLLIPFAEGDGRVAVGDGLHYLIGLFDAGGTRVGTVHRALPIRNRGPRELELRRESLRRSLGFRGPGGQRVDSREVDRQLDAAATEPVPYFDRGALFFDGKGRLWVFGTDQDSTVADVFSGTTYLGRIMIDCFNRWGWRSVAGAWLVMGCEPDPDTDIPELQLYRIVG
jgi:hypothetical protein